MRPVGLVRVLAFLVLSAASSLAASDDRPHLSSDPRVNQVRALIGDGRFAEMQFERQF